MKMTPSSKVPDQILGVGEKKKKESSTRNEVTPMTPSSTSPPIPLTPPP